MGVTPGRDWGEETLDQPDLVVEGGDAALASALSSLWSGTGSGTRPRPLVELRPTEPGGLAATLGLPHPHRAREGVRRALPLDVLVVRVVAPPSGDERALVVVSGLEVGAAIAQAAWHHRSREVRIAVDDRTPLDSRAVSVVVMTGEWLGRADANPRSHPGDGVAEIYLVDVPRPQRRAMRARLASGTHVPHPDIARRTGSRVRIELAAPAPIRADGVAVGRAPAVEVELLAGAYRLLV